MGKYDPDIGGVGMGPGAGLGVAAVLWPSDGPCLGGGDGTLVLGAWCLVLWCLVLVFHFLGGGQTILGL